MFTENQIHEILVLRKHLHLSFSMAVQSWPAALTGFIESKCILTGGASASAYHYEKINDFDLYIKDDIQMRTFENRILNSPGSWKDLIEDVNEKYDIQGHDGKMITTNAVTFKNRVQIILKANADHRKTFDFIHTMPYYDFADKKYFISEQQYMAIKDKKMVKNPNHTLSLSKKRIEKLTAKGWSF